MVVKNIKQYNNFFKRISSAIFLAILAISSNYLGSFYFFTLILFASFILLYEYYYIFSMKSFNADFFITYGIIVISCLLTYFNYLQYIFVLLIFGIIILYLVIDKSFFLYSTFSIIYFAIPSALLIYLNHNVLNGKEAILWLFVIVWATDTFGYITGKTFKGPKLTKMLSPNKTWSGFVGAIIGATIFSIIFCYLTNYQNLYKGALFGFFISLSSIFGDLFESYLKRKNNKKDSASWLPGHGGLLDRLDGFLFAIVILSLLTL